LSAHMYRTSCRSGKRANSILMLWTKTKRTFLTRHLPLNRAVQYQHNEVAAASNHGENRNFPKSSRDSMNSRMHWLISIKCFDNNSGTCINH
jgi:hypothetical protein